MPPIHAVKSLFSLSLSLSLSLSPMCLRCILSFFLFLCRCKCLCHVFVSLPFSCVSVENLHLSLFLYILSPCLLACLFLSCLLVCMFLSPFPSVYQLSVIFMFALFSVYLSLPNWQPRFQMVATAKLSPAA